MLFFWTVSRNVPETIFEKILDLKDKDNVSMQLAKAEDICV